jgi:GntR family transcriptional repressor for pyruvate dehydrogenase complex
MFVIIDNQKCYDYNKKLRIESFEMAEHTQESLRNNKTVSVAERVLKNIRDQIAAGTIKQNAQLPTEMELARQFNISRASVREAIKTLSYLGIVESRTSRGTRISNQSRLLERVAEWSIVLCCEDLRDAFVLGTALDSQVAIIAAEKINHSQQEHEVFCNSMTDILISLATASIVRDLDEYKRWFVKYFDSLYKFSNTDIFISLNECIDILITDRVCGAYYATDKLMEALLFLNSAWSAIQEYNLSEAVDIFQNYGAFAYDTLRSSLSVQDEALTP